MSAGLGYLPGLDGLRAVAVLAVLFYHGDLHLLSGGFLGVEVFFVISGYLITSLLLNEWSRAGGIDLKGFWLRRARRLLPALFFLLAVWLTLAVVFLPGEVASLRGDALASVGYVTNWYLIAAQKSYFETVGRPSIFRHLWSLAVEEQFYLLWPLLLAALLKWCKPRRAVWLVVAGAVASAAWMAYLYQPDVDPSRVYYGTDTRAAGLLMGAAFAFLWQPGKKPKQTRRAAGPRLDLIAAAGLAGLGVAFAVLGEFSPLLYQGGFALVGLATLLVIAGAVHPRARIGNWVGVRPLRWIGVRSYGIYLWHWPIFMVTRPQLDLALEGVPLFALRLALTLLCAELSYRFVESPIRSGALERAWHAWREAEGRRRTSLGLRWAGAFATAVAVIAALSVSMANARTPEPPAYLAVEMASVQVTSPAPTAVPVLDEQASSLVSSLASSSASSLLPPDQAPLMEEIPAAPTEAVAPFAGADIEEPDWPTNRARPQASASTPVPTAAAPFVPTLDGPAQVTAIGDSVMLGAAPQVRQALGRVEVDAQMGRQVSAAIAILKARLAANQVAPVVIIHMGNNGTFSQRQFDEMMGLLSNARRIVILNNKVPRAWQDSNNSIIMEGAHRYPNIVLLDWVAASAEHPEYFWNDGIHLRPEGARVYADLIAKAVAAP